MFSEDVDFLRIIAIALFFFLNMLEFNYGFKLRENKSNQNSDLQYFTIETKIEPSLLKNDNKFVFTMSIQW